MIWIDDAVWALPAVNSTLASLTSRINCSRLRSAIRRAEDFDEGLLLIDRQMIRRVENFAKVCHFFTTNEPKYGSKHILLLSFGKFQPK